MSRINILEGIYKTKYNSIKIWSGQTNSEKNHLIIWLNHNYNKKLIKIILIY